MINLPIPIGFGPKPNKRYKHKCVWRRTSPSERAEIAAYIAANSCEAAEAKYNISNTLTYAIRKEFNIKALPVGMPKTYTNADVANWKNMMDEGYGVSKVAMFFGISTATIRRRLPSTVVTMSWVRRHTLKPEPKR